MTIDRETVIRLAREADSYAYKKAIGAWDYGPIRDRYFAVLVLEHGRKPLTDEQIERLREKTFSTNNPYCPVDRKSMRKAVRAAEIAHGITDKESSDAE